MSVATFLVMPLVSCRLPAMLDSTQWVSGRGPTQAGAFMV